LNQQNTNTNSEKFLLVDGNYGEGGGSVLRLSSAFSVLTQIPIKIYNIRRNRPNPGLRTQHLVGLQSLAKLCNGKLSETKIGTTELTFEPGKIENKTININISTAGSIGLILQAIQIACINTDIEIKCVISGGATFGKWAPTITYLKKVTFKILERMGLHTKINILKHGFYPRGGAKAEVVIRAQKQIKSIHLNEIGNICEISGISIGSDFLKKQKVAERQAKSARRFIRDKLKFDCDIRIEYVNSLNPGSGICIWLKTDSGVILGADKVGEKKIRAEIIGQECADFLFNTYKNNATCDTFLSDQLIPFMAMANGSSEFLTTRLTNHTKTNIWLAKQFLKRDFSIDEKDNSVKIVCK